MKPKSTRPKPTPKKDHRTLDEKLDALEIVEWEDYLGDVRERERKKKGPNEEAQKLLRK